MILFIKNIWKFEKAGIVAGLVFGVPLGALGMAALVSATGITVLP
jgi:hypothetical protein